MSEEERTCFTCKYYLYVARWCVRHKQHFPNTKSCKKYKSFITKD
jgi:hypothetical protein